MQQLFGVPIVTEATNPEKLKEVGNVADSEAYHEADDDGNHGL